jgi:hypothetical protein
VASPNGVNAEVIEKSQKRRKRGVMVSQNLKRGQGNIQEKGSVRTLRYYTLAKAGLAKT